MTKIVQVERSAKQKINFFCLQSRNAAYLARFERYSKLRGVPNKISCSLSFGEKGIKIANISYFDKKNCGIHKKVLHL
jgi:hypothetical protein